jgi:hypothetical protein
MNEEESRLPVSYIIGLLEICELAQVSPLIARSFVLERTPLDHQVTHRLSEMKDAARTVEEVQTDDIIAAAFPKNAMQ